MILEGLWNLHMLCQFTLKQLIDNSLGASDFFSSFSYNEQATNDNDTSFTGLL